MFVWSKAKAELYKKLVKKAKFAHSAKNHGLHSQLAFEGKGVGVKSVVTLEGQTPALNTKLYNYL
jgi:hypothetical protein